MVVRVTMDIFQHRYYKLGKMLMLLTGTWPYQSIRARRGILFVVILLIGYQVAAQILAVLKYGHDWNILLECFVPNVFDTVCASKYLCLTFNSQKILKVLDRIRMDWQVWARHQEIKILHEYAERGGNIITVYTASLYFAIFVFTIHPMITKLIDVMLKNGTEPGRFLFPVVYYHLDVQKYYFYLIVYATVCALTIITTFASSEIMLIIWVQHVCGIFAAVGHKLKRIGDSDTSAKTKESPYGLVKTDMDPGFCIDRHNEAIECSNLINAIYSWNIFCTIVFGMILFNASGLQMLLKTDNDLGASLTFMILSLGSVLCFFLECGVSQILIDHSISIRFYINNSQWYKLPPKTQKILRLTTMRCNVPCHLTAGYMLIMSLHTFGVAMRTTMSYFAFMRSMQGI